MMIVSGPAASRSCPTIESKFAANVCSVLGIAAVHSADSLPAQTSKSVAPSLPPICNVTTATSSSASSLPLRVRSSWTADSSCPSAIIELVVSPPTPRLISSTGSSLSTAACTYARNCGAKPVVAGSDAPVPCEIESPSAMWAPGGSSSSEQPMATAAARTGTASVMPALFQILVSLIAKLLLLPPASSCFLLLPPASSCFLPRAECGLERPTTSGFPWRSGRASAGRPAAESGVAASSAGRADAHRNELLIGAG